MTNKAKLFLRLATSDAFPQVINCFAVDCPLKKSVIVSKLRLKYDQWLKFRRHLWLVDFLTALLTSDMRYVVQ